MTKYTLHRQDGNAGLDGFFEVRVGDVVVFEGLECHCLDYVRDNPWEANARLIAAAPDLLEACEHAMEFFLNGTPIHVGSVVHHQIAAAIAKARGERYDDPTLGVQNSLAHPNGRFNTFEAAKKAAREASEREGMQFVVRSHGGMWFVSNPLIG